MTINRHRTQCSSWSWKTTGRTNLHKLIFIVNPRWRRCPTRMTTWCTKIAPPFSLIGRLLQLQAQNNADESPKKPKGSRKMTGRWKNDRALRKNDRALNKTTGRCALSFRPSENSADHMKFFFSSAPHDWLQFDQWNIQSSTGVGHKRSNTMKKKHISPPLAPLALLEYWILNPLRATASLDLKTIKREFPEEPKTSGKSIPQNLPRILENSESPSYMMTWSLLHVGCSSNSNDCTCK